MIRKYIEEKLDNLTLSELKKYKAYDNYTGNGLGVDVTLSNGTKVKTEETNLDKLSIFKGVLKYENSREAGDFIANPKMVRDGRHGLTTYVFPVLDSAQEEFNKGI